MEIHGTKICFVCKQEKIKLAFAVCSHNKDGLYHMCRDCSNTDNKRREAKKKKPNNIIDPYS